MTREARIEGFRNPVWTPRELEPHERVAVEQSLIAIEARLVPASREAIKAHLGRLMNACGTEHRLTAAEIDSKQEEYTKHLAEFSEAHLVRSIAEWVRNEKWFPKIAELRMLLIGRQSTANVMRHRARVLLGLEPPKDWELSMAERLKSQRERAAADARVPDLAQRIENLPRELAEQTRRLVQAAQATPVEKRGNL